MLCHPHIFACLSQVQSYHHRLLLLLVDLCYQYYRLATLSDALKEYTSYKIVQNVYKDYYLPTEKTDFGVL